MILRSVVQILRPHQWLKNTFVFLPLFFAGQFLHVDLLLQCLVVFFAFSFVASSIYCFNDIRDVEADRQHRIKRNRPLASGALSIRTGYILMAAMLIASAAVVCLLVGDGVRYKVTGVLLLYFVMNIAYCLYLKRKTLVDVFIIATGFVLRVIIGGVATGVELSNWIVIMTFLLALFLAFAKRRDDVVLYADTGVKVRGNIDRYNLEFMNQAITIIATVTLVAYVMYTVSPEVVKRFNSPFIYVTSVFVLLGIVRYLQLTIVDVRSGSPTKLLMNDHFIQVCILAWIATFVGIIYL